MPKKAHPADQADLAKIATATHFNVHLRTGPANKINREAPTLIEAIRIADEIGASVGGRRPMIYAVTPDKMTVHVPVGMIAQARQEPATGTRKGKTATNAGRQAKRATAPRRAASKGKGARPIGRRAEIAVNAAKGILPPVPDFSAETHRRFRGKLAEIVKLIEAGDVAALKAFPINPYSSSPKAMDRYRNLAAQAIEARRLIPH